MSKRMVVVAVTAAGVVGLGSAAVAAVGPLGGASLDDVQERLPGVAQQVDDRLGQALDEQRLNVPGQADLAGAIEELRGRLDDGGFSLDSADLSGDRLAVALDNLAGRIRAGSDRLSEAQAEGANRLASQLVRAASALRNTSVPGGGGSASASTQASVEDSRGSVHGDGSMSSQHAGGSVAGGGSVEARQAFERLQTALEQLREMDGSDVLTGPTGDILDRESAEAQIRRVTTRLRGLLG